MNKIFVHVRVLGGKVASVWVEADEGADLRDGEYVVLAEPQAPLPPAGQRTQLEFHTGISIGYWSALKEGTI